MKSCPTCNRTFEDTLTYCLIDGSILDAPFDPHATLVIPEPRQTEPPPTEVLPVEEIREEIPPTVASPQPERKAEESVSTIAAPESAFESPKINISSVRPARKSKRLPQIIVGLAALVSVGLAIFLLISYRAREDSSSKSSATANNSRAGNNLAADSSSEYYPPAPDIEFTTLENGRFRLSQLRGQVVVLNFWATWCIPCRDQTSLLNYLKTGFENTGLSVVRVSSEPVGDIEEFQKQDKQYYLLLHADETELRKFEMGISLPTTLIIDRDGRIREKIIGTLDRIKVEETINQLRGTGKTE
jgi:peroxiredoxin